MTTIEAILLGVIQGITEFLPVSSSGHLELAQYFLGFQNLSRYTLFNLVCHLGTLGAITTIFFSQIKQSLTIQKTRLLQIAIATLPLFPLVFIMKQIKAVFDQPQYLGICFLITAAFIFFSLKGRPLTTDIRPRNRWIDPLTIGVFQAVAILPGISRSGATISTALLLGWEKQEAISFSFLLAIPAILGGTVLEVIHLIRTPVEEWAPISAEQFLVGFATSFAVGCFALWLLMRMVAQNKWSYFGWYCLLLGITTTLYFNFFG